jgi:NuA3 HAT complex component NTO1
MSSVTDASQVQSQIVDDRNSKKDLSAEDKDKRKLAKRIVKAVQVLLADAIHKESELLRRPYEEELIDFDQLLERSLSSRRLSEASVVKTVLDAEATIDRLSIGEIGNENNADTMDIDTKIEEPDNIAFTHEASSLPIEVKPSSPQNLLTPASMGIHISGSEGNANLPSADEITDPVNAMPSSEQTTHPHPALTPPLSTNSSNNHTQQSNMRNLADQATPLTLGGVPWYMEAFDPHGTTIYEERWTGRDVARGMSEDLTDLDEDELDGLVDADGIVPGSGYVLGEVGDETPNDAEAATRNGARGTTKGKQPERKKNGKVKRRWKGFK